MLENKGDAHHQLEAESNSTSSPPRNPVAGRTKIDAQDAYRLRFQRFLISWKDNFITFPMPPVSPQNSIRVNGKRRNKSASRIYQGAASPSFGPLGRVSCWSPLGARPGVLHALTLIYSVAATTLGLGFCLDLFCHRQCRRSSACETPLRDQYSFDCNFSVLACVLGCTCRDKNSWRGHSCDTGDNQRSSGVVIARSRSFGALDHQRRDLHFNRLYLTSWKIGPNPLSKNTYYGFVEDIIELDYGWNLQVPIFKCKWARVPNGVEVDNYGFTIVDLNVAGYKNDPWILADNVAQVFYITDPVNAKKEIALPGKQRVAGVDNVTDPEEYNQFDDVPPFGDPKKLKQVEIALRRTNAIPYLRTDAKGQLVQGK